MGLRRELKNMVLAEERSIGSDGLVIIKLTAHCCLKGIKDCPGNNMSLVHTKIIDVY